MRLGEIAGLKRNQVDLKARTIRLNAGETKNDQGRGIPMNTEAFEMLSAPPQHTEQVFQDGKAPIGQFRKSWRAACVRAGSARTNSCRMGKGL
jgi:integrase